MTGADVFVITADEAGELADDSDEKPPEGLAEEFGPEEDEAGMELEPD